tara:strand:- start:256 stop:621 length:366 start_codon:yes stop_codon:yes gene_type:complete
MPVSSLYPSHPDDAASHSALAASGLKLKEQDMKLTTTLTASALVLAVAGTSAFAQGREGQRIGYYDDSEVTYSSRNNDTHVKVEQRMVYDDGNLRPEKQHLDTFTSYQTSREDELDDRVPR